MAEQILLIDDDLEHSDALKTYLERLQYDVTLAATFDEVFHYLENAAWDIVLGNLLMDEKTAECVMRITGSKHYTQMIAYGSETRLNQAMDRFGLKVVEYLLLPLNSKALALSLKRAKKINFQMRKNYRYVERLTDLHNAQNQFNQLFDAVPCYITVQDKNLRITAMNSRFEQHFGNHIGGHCYKIYKHRTSQCDKCPVVQTFQDGKTHSTEEIVTSISGKQYNVLTQTAPIKNRKGDITQVMEISTNITQIRQLQDHLTSLGLMLGSMSHGVKGMLTALDGGVYQLETGLNQKDELRVFKAFGQVKMMTDKIKKMVLEILYYAKSRELQYTTMEISAVVASVVNSIKPVALRSNVDFVVSVPDNLGEMEVDPSWMEAALINFLENAVDACAFDREKSEHQVTLAVTSSKNDTICFEITDNGIGMDQETREKMFTLFFTSKGSQGTGLGLFIAHRVICQHGGTVDVTSEQKQGSVFTINLPRKRPTHLTSNGLPPAIP
jgi:signal transduction histidine kinase/DNA-binding response OmpR family regulator